MGRGGERRKGSKKGRLEEKEGGGKALLPQENVFPRNWAEKERKGKERKREGGSSKEKPRVLEGMVFTSELQRSKLNQRSSGARTVRDRRGGGLKWGKG